VQCYNFGVVSGLVYGISRAVAALGLISQELADGVLITSCLSMSVNMVAILTRACNGDEAAAVFNQAFGNMTGVFLSPSLILGYLGVSADIKLGEIFYQLSLRIVVPVIVGQLLQKTSHYVSNMGTKYKNHFKHIQEYSLLFIIYCTFCKVFKKGSQQTLGQVFAVVLYQLLQLLLLMVIAWYLLRLFWKDEPALRVMGLFGCTHKTIAMGVPLISTMYKDDPNLGQYVLPILIWHPMQLIVGTLLTPRLSNFIIKEKERLGIVDDDADICHTNNSNNDDDDGNDDEEAQEENGCALTPDSTAQLVSDNDDEDKGDNDSIRA
jgi:sodium/bile acid cotransporter 7